MCVWWVGLSFSVCVCVSLSLPLLPLSPSLSLSLPLSPSLFLARVAQGLCACAAVGRAAMEIVSQLNVLDEEGRRIPLCVHQVGLGGVTCFANHVPCWRLPCLRLLCLNAGLPCIFNSLPLLHVHHFLPLPPPFFSRRRWTTLYAAARLSGRRK